ncbi:MAG TPA: FmdB family zinc ribbon protein, partial [Acidimicrobiales bacterium]|nr:FmdB family zinc ribbon protein [Acidimicrobiales bacterium]
EVVQSFKDDALTECPACAGPLRKVFGNIGVAFKGSGFYKTDSRSETGKGAHKSGEAKPADAAAATTTKSEGSKSEGSKSEGSKAAPAGSGPSKSSGGSPKVAAAS